MRRAAVCFKAFLFAVLNGLLLTLPDRMMNNYQNAPQILKPVVFFNCRCYSFIGVVYEN